MWGETDLQAFQGTGLTAQVSFSDGDLIYSPGTNEIYRVAYTQGPNTGAGPTVTAHFYWEVAIFDFTAETVVHTDFGIGPRHIIIADWSTLFRQMNYGISFSGCVGGKIYLGRADISSTGTNYDCVEINTAAHTASVLDNVYADGTQEGLPGQVAADGNLYCTATNYSLVIDDSGPTFTTTTHGGLLPCGNAFSSMGVDSSNRIYVTPDRVSSGDMLVIDTAGTSSLTDLGLSADALRHKGAASQASDGLMYLVPRKPLVGNIPAASRKFIRFNPGTLVGAEMDDFGNNHGVGSGVMSNSTEILAFQSTSASGGVLNVFGFRPLVGAAAIDPPVDNSLFAPGIIVKKGRPLRSPFLLYDTENWDGSWTLENLGSAGPDWDVNFFHFVEADTPTAGDYMWNLGFSTVIQDVTGYGAEMYGGPVYGEAYTGMWVVSADAPDDNTDAGGGNFSKTSFGITFDGDYDVSDDELVVRIIGTSAGSTTGRISPFPANTLVTVVYDMRQGGGNVIIDETWYHTHSAGGIVVTQSQTQANLLTASVNQGPIVSARPFIISTSKITASGTVLPLVGDPWPGVRAFALFRGEPTPADITTWKTFFGL